MRHRSVRKLSQLCALLVLIGCGDDGIPKDRVFGFSDRPYDAGEPDAAGTDAATETMVPMAAAPTPAGADTPPPPPKPGPCRAVEAPPTETVPARDEVTSAAPVMTEQTFFTRDLFERFKTQCGGCHVDARQGSFQVTRDTFSDGMRSKQDAVRSRVKSDDQNYFMPPLVMGGKPWSSRGQVDPIVELMSLLETWFEQGLPADAFVLQKEAQSSEMYQLSASVAAGLTNMGSCIPDRTGVGLDVEGMDTLDVFFAGLDGTQKPLPESLTQTDIISFDSDVLARRSVISFAPGYPLFSDEARKMRHVRVPRGQSIRFNEETQEFEIPANTRFYKTFLKRVIDKNGNERYRKIETRIIVSRPDGPDGSRDTRALFGTYAWNDSETEATLVTDPRRNGQPFRDRLITYFIDEAKAQGVLAQNPKRKDVALLESGAIRRYAIPGSDRCVQCHMGSHNQSFVLGMTPLQIKRRPKGEGGVIEETGADELSQLQRLIDYRVITGIKSLDQILPLEQSQGDRKPRNEHELLAQSYMLGNCSHCHNPRGYPTMENPVLNDVLRFFPDREGGIFQFPLDRVSPRIRRGVSQDIELPYITPSLFDLSPRLRRHLMGDVPGELYYLAAPWRSLIYRNVDSPFPYADDYVLFPHMPMNAPGFDCRVPRILGDWMVSIPAKRKATANAAQATEDEDPTAQLYEEIKPGDPEYADALLAAQERLDYYHKGGQLPADDTSNTKPGALSAKSLSLTAEKLYLAGYKYSDYCPDTSDIVAPEIEGAVFAPDDLSSIPNVRTRAVREGSTPDDPMLARFMNLSDGLPDRAHWVETDITDPPGDWYPRNPDWKEVLVTHQSMEAKESVRAVVDDLQTRTLTPELREFVLRERPFTLWTQKPGCDLSRQRTVDSFPEAERLSWMTLSREGWSAPKPTDRVYMHSWGSAVFNEICVNCHGPNYDSRGRQADTLLNMTGGQTRVANFRDGLFGPVTAPGDNRKRVFGMEGVATPEVAADDWSARYMAWMGLGGTRRVIPESILSVVSTAQVFGVRRPGNVDLTNSGANMLAIAQSLCNHTLGRIDGANVAFDDIRGRPVSGGEPGDVQGNVALVDVNADEQMWLELCSFNNRPPVRVVRVLAWESAIGNGTLLPFYLDARSPITNAWYHPEAYPSTSTVVQVDTQAIEIGAIGDHNGNVMNGITPSNLAPWCVEVPDEHLSFLSTYAAKNRGGKPLPVCPKEWLANPDHQLYARDPMIPEPPPGTPPDERDAWARRGAINTGFAVFLYLDQISKDAASSGRKPCPAYNRCEDLNDTSRCWNPAK